jgi:hypothetical protein
MQAVKAAKRHPQLLQKAHADSLLLARFTWSLFPAAMPGFLFKRPTRLAGCSHMYTCGNTRKVGRKPRVGRPSSFLPRLPCLAPSEPCAVSRAFYCQRLTLIGGRGVSLTPPVSTADREYRPERGSFRPAGCLGSVAEVLSLRFPPNASPELNNLGLASSLPCGWLVTGSNGENRAERRALSGVPTVTIRPHWKSLRRCSLGRRRSTSNIRL